MAATSAQEHPDGWLKDVVPPVSPTPDAGNRDWELWPIMIKYKGVFNLTGLYRMMATWFKSRKFELHEKLFKAKPPELQIFWEAFRRSNAYFMDDMLVFIHILDLEDIEVIQKGVRKRLSKGRMTIRIIPKVVSDYDDIFGERKWRTVLERRLMAFMNQYVLKQEINFPQTDRFYYEAYKLQTEIKAFLDMTAKGSAY